MPNNLGAHSSFYKERQVFLTIGMDEDGKKEPRENTEPPAFRREGNLSAMWQNKNKTTLPA